jgi:4-amino-4-deoxy-L-arabinose transferase-like glycosyltransferase
MPHLSIFRSALCGVAAYVLMLAGLNSIGLVGPDEPRYADVAREMYFSGDYVTPRLFGKPWFEKPPLYYWLAALSFRLGISEFSARFPSALFAILFLGVWYWFVDRHYGQRAAQWSCLILSTSLGWIGFARAAAMDMLLATTLSAALAFFFTWWFAEASVTPQRGDPTLPDRSSWPLYAFYAALALATLSKGPLAVLLAGLVIVPCILQGRAWAAILKMLLTPAVALYAVIALPWYVLCYLRNGWPFIEEFFIRHNLQRFTSGEAIGHPQPPWFYFPVLPAAIFPWSPLLLITAVSLMRTSWRKIFATPKITALVAWIALPLAFFSASANKLPGYLLPILPPLSLLLALAISRERLKSDPPEVMGLPALWKKVALCTSAAFILLIPLFAWVLPESLSTGLSTAMRQMNELGFLRSVASSGVPNMMWATAVAFVVIAIILAARESNVESGGAIGLGVCACLAGMLIYMSPTINAIASARNVAQRAVMLGVDPQELGTLYIHRNQVYGLGFYLGVGLPEWRPDDPTQHFSYIAARDEFKVDEFRPGAHLLASFPRQNLRLWALPSKKVLESPVPASLRGNN